VADKKAVKYLVNSVVLYLMMGVWLMYEGRRISNAHSEISRKRDLVFKQTKLGSKVQYFSYKLT
jgi:putative Ca2+/H+ antiporter (TMEM165/GDT1 family)